jgi:hypothetical protein
MIHIDVYIEMNICFYFNIICILINNEYLYHMWYILILQKIQIHFKYENKNN